MHAADPVISEIFFDPPGPDAPHEYIEIRAQPNSIIETGVCLVAIEGNAGSNPGTIQSVIDLSGRRVGGNGFLVLLQKGANYQSHAGAVVLTNSGSGDGWGSGSGSSIAFRGNGGRTDLENAAATFMLIRSMDLPSVGADVDADDDGVLDGSTTGQWTVLDSVGICDETGAGDIVYGSINFRYSKAPGSGATAGNTIVPVAFTPRYVARANNSSGSNAADWVASDIQGTAPDWRLGGESATRPQALARMPLNHLGKENFGASPLPGLLMLETDGVSEVTEEGTSDTVMIGLNSVPSGPVSLLVSAGAQLEISANAGETFFPEVLLVLTNDALQEVLVRAVKDDVLRHGWSSLHGRLVLTEDAQDYPLTSLACSLPVRVIQDESLLLNEINANPQGPEDGPFEFIELRGTPGAMLSNLFLVQIEGEVSENPGTATWILDLSGNLVGSNGLLLITAAPGIYEPAPETQVALDSRLEAVDGVFANRTVSFLLLTMANSFNEGDDLDKGDDGKLEGLPVEAVILDSIGWSDGGRNDRIYAFAELNLKDGAPDAAFRVPGDNRANNPAAWQFGNLAGTLGDSVRFGSSVSPEFSSGTTLTPGQPNNTAPSIKVIQPISGVIGDPSNPRVRVAASDRESDLSVLRVFITSTNESVLTSQNCVLAPESPGTWILDMKPTGVGYSEVRVSVTDGRMTNTAGFAYAASAPGRPGTLWHIGAADGSTAVVVDSDYLLIGDDENQILRVYSRHRSGLPLAHFDFSQALELPEYNSGMPREVDIEASTRVGDRLYWIGSHGRSALGESRTHRTRIFAVDMSVSEGSVNLSYAGRYDYLKLDLIDWDNRNLHGKGSGYYGLEASDQDGVPPKAPDGSGFAIEGLTMMPGDTNGAYVAFRAPIVPATNRLFALIIPVLNFTSVVVTGMPPGSCLFGAPIELDLLGRGIRSIEGTEAGYLLIGGPPGGDVGPYPMDFRMYSWNGGATAAPRQRAADLDGLNAEGILEVPPDIGPDSSIVLISDNGATSFYGDGIPAKALSIPNFRKNRSDHVLLGPEVPVQPIILAAERRGDLFYLKWRAVRGEMYVVETSEELAGAWNAASGRMEGTGPFMEALLPAGHSMLYLRIAASLPAPAFE